eukprot:CAMPEP_0203761202 /NCGR_PEP_ID=MMETSP0098-20131031/14334_1 /ASSEMBLY_ACC=CAM_ASM_000208 /TAXON_ID=96639 /ORGANISM=" , Strain NY0313808BC1" /LENGTH=303 /DNA_ID=CAMNT_0050655089 /DNA_START=137 /DNA_END=1048 /DNA_ORIENTATION=+
MLPVMLPTLLNLLWAALGVALGVAMERSGWGDRCKAILDRMFVRRGPKCRLVGAGPGDPALLTVAARYAIQEADVVIADRLVSQDTLNLVRGKLIVSRKYKGCANKAQDELQRWTLEALDQGLDVVRLKGGDPFIYGRGAEEVDDFRKHGFDVQVIPGISSSLCAPLAAGIAATTRGVADQLLIATGHGMNDTVPRDIAPFYAGRTTMYLMSVSRMEQLMKRLTQAGYPAATLVAVIEKATTKEQRVVRGTVGTISDIAKAEDVKSPATIVVGRATGALEHGSIYQYNHGSVRFHALPTISCI